MPRSRNVDRSAFFDDWARIMLDTFNDNRRAYVFWVNPLGIQQDGLWIEGSETTGSGLPINLNPDFIWDSYGRVTAEGWVAEVRIPYVSLRLRDAPAQNWGINIAREVKRSGFKESWAPLTRNQANTLIQGGRLTGLRGIEPQRLIEVNPVLTGKRTSERLGSGEWVQGDFESEIGGNLRYGITPNLVLDATVNPDFSQVEADAGQIAVNERFALFFPEKRPFFLEGTEVFQTPQRLVYTRAIVEPIGGAKLTGKVGSFNIGFLGALDQSPLLDSGTGENALFNIFRLRRDVGAGSTVGLLYTDRTFTGADQYNRVLAADARLLFADRYSLTAQLAESWTKTTRAGASAAAPMLFLQLERSGRGLSWEVRLDDMAPDFRARSGFLRRIGDAQLFAGAEYTFYGKPGALLERWGPELRIDNFWDHDALWQAGSPKEGEVELQWNFNFRGRHRLNAILRDGYFEFQPDDYLAYETESPGGVRAPFATPPALRHMLGLALLPNLQPRPWLSIGGRLFFREVPIFAEANRGFEFLFAPDVRIWPSDGVSVELSHQLSQLWRTRDESRFSTANISRLKVQYQLSRSLSARAIAQYNLQDRAPLMDPITRLPIFVGGDRELRVEEGEFGMDLLAAYEPSPGTVIYLGYAREMAGPNTYRYGALEPQAEGLFLKASYLYRF